MERRRKTNKIVMTHAVPKTTEKLWSGQFMCPVCKTEYSANSSDLRKYVYRQNSKSDTDGIKIFVYCPLLDCTWFETVALKEENSNLWLFADGLTMDVLKRVQHINLK
jgi:hypothetical protein